MANPEHLAKLKEGVEAWNKWREENISVKPDLIGAGVLRANLRAANLKETNLRGASLNEADLWNANLSNTDLSNANLSSANLLIANLSNANLVRANLGNANLGNTNLVKANLTNANLQKAYLWEANFANADLSGVDLRHANLGKASLKKANLSNADLRGADMFGANLSEADLTNANLQQTQLIGTNFERAKLDGCKIYGISAWDLDLEDSIQKNLIISRNDEPAITVDNLEVAQFIYLLLNNAKVRDVINTITTKSVLILGRFKEDRKIVLDAIRDHLRQRDYIPILFDFDKPDDRDSTETVATLAHLARFIIADLTEHSSIPHELATIVPHIRSVPVQSILMEGFPEYAMFADFRSYPWMLEPHIYTDKDTLLGELLEKVIQPAEARVLHLKQSPLEQATAQIENLSLAELEVLGQKVEQALKKTED